MARVARWAWDRWGWRRRALALGALLLGALLLLPRAPDVARLESDFPHAQPAALAHFLADFSNLARLHPYVESWTIESEWSNYTSWEYAVTYECGARCRGRSTLSAHELRPGAPQHGSPAQHAHRLLATDTRCAHLPLLPWPTFCEETETETLVEARAGGGARLAERARARCGPLAALAALGGQCARDLLAARRRQLHALRAALALAPTRAL